MHWLIVLLIILIVVAAILFLLYRFGAKLQDKQLAQKEQLLAAAQPATMLIIDKKIMPMKDAGLPKQAYEQTPKRYLKANIPVVKAKVGPQIINFIADDAIYEDIPTKGEVKAMVSGIYIVSVKSVRKNKKNAAAPEEDKKKGNFRTRMMKKQANYQKQLNDELLARKQNEEKRPKKSKEEIKRERDKAKKIKNDF